MSITNGHMSSSIIYRYTLVPKNTGKYTIPSFTMQHEGGTYKTEPIQVTILPAGKAPQQSRDSAASDASAAQRNLFVTASVDKPSAFVNEQVNYTFKFYRRIRLLANPQYTPANFTGMWTEDTAPKNYYSTVNGAQYLVTEVKTLLFPTKPGRFNLGEAALQCNVEDFSQNDPTSDAFFSSFFSGGRTQVVRTNPVSFNVLPLPEEGRPAGFSGAVGNFNIAASIDKRSVKANEPVTLTVTISGSGNIKTVPEPQLPDWQDFKKYETVSSLNVNKDEDRLKGSREFKTIIVPLTAGEKTIKPLTFAFFDPVKRSYKVVSTGELKLDVKPAAPGTSAETAVTGLKGGLKVMASDIRYIKTPGSWKRAAGPLYEKPWFLALNAFPLVFLGIFFGYATWQRKLTGDVAFARRLRATSTAKKFLKKAKALMNSGVKAEDYYLAVSKALLEYVADKTNVSADGLTAASLEEILTERKVSRETIAAAAKILDECSMVRFAPTSVTPEMNRAVYDEAEEVIGRLEKEMRLK
jgi:hypothetical protein